MKTSLDQVKEFHTLFNHPIESKSVIPSKDRIKLRLSLILEELTELAEASGEIEMFTEMLIDTAEKNKDKKDNQNLKECLDAFCDIRYVVDGSILEYGMYQNFNDAFSEVHRSNMSKACNTLDEANQTVLDYKTNKNVDAIIIEKDNLFLVVNKDNLKTLKSSYYSAASLDQYI